MLYIKNQKGTGKQDYTLVGQQVKTTTQNGQCCILAVRDFSCSFQICMIYHDPRSSSRSWGQKSTLSDQTVQGVNQLNFSYKWWNSMLFWSYYSPILPVFYLFFIFILHIWLIFHVYFIYFTIIFKLLLYTFYILFQTL